jgi:hypothetical protein
LPARFLHPCFRAWQTARRPGSRTRRRRRRRVTARRLPHLHTRSAQATGRSPGYTHDLRAQPQTPGQQQSGATAETRTHRRDARSAPGLDGAARRDAGTRSLLPTCTRGMARRPARTYSCPHEHGAKAEPFPLPRTATAAPKSTGGSGTPSVAARHAYGTTATCPARFHVDALRHHGNTGKTKEGKRERCGGAHEGSTV